jgi:hypothetical protein
MSSHQRAQFTAGPWSAEGPDDFGDFNILHRGDSLAVAAVVSNMRHPHIVSANAMIVASAPELFDMLLQARREYGAFGRLSGETLVQMDRILAKAGRVGQ